MIPFYIACKGTNEAREIDSRLVYKDGAARDLTGGSAYTASMRSAPLSLAGEGGYGFVGNVVQHVEQTAGATITGTPVMDGDPDDTQTIAETVAAGDESAVEFPWHSGGREVQVDFTLSGFVSEVELGSAEFWIIPRRAHR